MALLHTSSSPLPRLYFYISLGIFVLTSAYEEAFLLFRNSFIARVKGPKLPRVTEAFKYASSHLDEDDKTPEDFLFALLAMLVDKYGATENIKSFASELTGSFGVEVQLQSAGKYLDLVTDVLKPKPSYSNVLLRTHEDGDSDPHGIALDELTLLSHLLS